MKDTSISENIVYIGVDDKTIDLFESQYEVPNGVSYNSYLIKDEKTVVMDTVDKRKTDEWVNNLEKALNGKTPDYLVVSHLEPDHGYNIELIAKKYTEMKIVGNEKTFAFMPQFFDIPNLEERKVIVKEGDELNIGKHTLQFFMAPMVHWPEVMVTYEKTEKVLFTADGFGKFGALDVDEPWDDEARRYYINIVGKYGMQVQALLKKATALDIKMICPLHGPILKEDLLHYIKLYDLWSSYTPEEDGVLIAYSSIHGNTANAVRELEKILQEKGAKKVVIRDLARDDMAQVIGEAFKYDKLICASSSYNFDLFPPMDHFLRHLKSKNYQNRKIGVIENGTWAPSAGRCMNEIISGMKDITLVEPMVTIKTTLKDDSRNTMQELAENILK